MSYHRTDANDGALIEADYQGGKWITIWGHDGVEGGGGLFTPTQAREIAQGLLKLAGEAEEAPHA